MRFLIFFLPVCLFGGWAEQALEEMTLEEKVGQLFMAPVCPLRKEDHWDDWMRLMEEHCIGNAIVKQADPDSQVEFLNRLQEKAKIPLLVAGDTEWGLAMRMAGTIAFPRQMTLGAIGDLGLIYEMGKEIGREARLVGIHLCLAPVADVNNNPANPIIHMRSFGEDAHEVAKRVSAYARGFAAAGVIACAKHFPGHGDTSVDSHQDLPFLPFSRERLEAIEWIPFRRAIADGIGALMSAHLLVPCLDPEVPVSLSPLLKRVVRDELGFGGLLISDALNMRAVSRRFSPEEAALLARRAGTDLLLYGDHLDPTVDQLLKEHIPRACRALKKAYASGELAVEDLNASVLRILRAKEQLGFHETSRFKTGDLHTEEALRLKRRLFQEAVTLIGDLPVLQDGAAYLSLGEGDVLGQEFAHRFHAPLALDAAQKDALFDALRHFDQVVIALHEADLKAENFGLSDALLELIDALSDRAIFCHFATPYALSLFPTQKRRLVGYENDPEAQRAVYQVLKGQQSAKGRLPISGIGETVSMTLKIESMLS